MNGRIGDEREDDDGLDGDRCRCLILPSILLFFLQWCDGGVDEDLWRWHGGRAPPCHDVNDVVDGG